MARLRGLLLLVATLLVPAACTAQDTTENTAMAEARQLLRRVVLHDGIERVYFVHVPAGVEGPHCPADTDVSSCATVRILYGISSIAIGDQPIRKIC